MAPGKAEGGVASLRRCGVSGLLALGAPRSRLDEIDIVSVLSLFDAVVRNDELLDFLDNTLVSFHRLDCPDC
jgi:hypothetical protein